MKKEREKERKRRGEKGLVYLSNGMREEKRERERERERRRK